MLGKCPLIEAASTLLTLDETIRLRYAYRLCLAPMLVSSSVNHVLQKLVGFDPWRRALKN